ncbi:hypothetical protein CsSME_00051615 [Camellia sinensis var. sinensis]
MVFENQSPINFGPGTGISVLAPYPARPVPVPVHP